MMRLRDVRDCVATFGIAVDENCYCGRMADKKDESIGTYPIKDGREANATLGGEENRSYGTKAVSFLVHWNKSPTETEEAAFRLHKALSECRGVTVNECEIKFIQLSHEEPVPVDTDENGIFEYVVECLVYYGKEQTICQK